MLTVVDDSGSWQSKINLDGQPVAKLQSDVYLPFIKAERFSGYAFSHRIPLMYSVFLRKTGLMVNILAQDMFVPVVTETSVLSYDNKTMIESLGSVQNSLKLMNLVEFYLFILIVIFGSVGGISLAISAKFISFFRREDLSVDLKSTIINGVDVDAHESMHSILD